MMEDTDQDAALLVFTNAPDREVAGRIAEALVDKRLAACVNVLAGCTSLYRWQGEVERVEEIPMIIKTRAARYPEVEALIRHLHPYELPEIVAVPVTRGLPDYLQWVAEETAIPIG
jgi:periplasmic divalent cation tolerance protein